MVTDDVGGEDDEIAGDVCGEEAAKCKKADRVGAAGDTAEQHGKQFVGERFVDNGQREPGHRSGGLRGHAVHRQQSAKRLGSVRRAVHACGSNAPI